MSNAAVTVETEITDWFGIEKGVGAYAKDPGVSTVIQPLLGTSYAA